MKKHPLLPEAYADRATQTAVLFALGAYERADRADSVNPRQKWDLQRAWNDAGLLLARGGWRYKGTQEAAEIGYELFADTEEEIKDLNAVIAGIVAYQIMEPESGVSLNRVEYRKGGEMALVLSSDVMDKLKEMYPAMLLLRDTGEKKKRWWDILRWKK